MSKDREGEYHKCKHFIFILHTRPLNPSWIRKSEWKWCVTGSLLCAFCRIYFQTFIKTICIINKLWRHILLYIILSVTDVSYYTVIYTKRCYNYTCLDGVHRVDVYKRKGGAWTKSEVQTVETTKTYLSSLISPTTPPFRDKRTPLSVLIEGTLKHTLC